MPSKVKHEAQAQHNQRILACLPGDALDWRITLMMYTALHAIRAYISQARPGYSGTDFNYESIPRILQQEVPDPQDEMATAFIALKSICHSARYACKEQAWLERKFPEAEAAYHDILKRLRNLEVDI